MSNMRAVLISLIIAVFAVLLLFSYINGKEKKLLEMASPMQVVVAARDIPEGVRIEENMLRFEKIPQKFVQPGAFSDVQRLLNRSISVPVLRGTQIIEPMFRVDEAERIALKIPSNNRAFSIFVTDVTAVGQLIQPGDMVDLMVTVETGTFRDGQLVSEEIVTRTALENILVLAVNQTSSARRTNSGGENLQQVPGSVLRGGRQMLTGTVMEGIKTLTLSLSPGETQILNLAQEIGTISAALRSSFDAGKIENLPPLSAQEFLGIDKSIVPRSRPAWVEIRGADAFSRY